MKRIGCCRRQASSCSTSRLRTSERLHQPRVSSRQPGAPSARVVPHSCVSARGSFLRERLIHVEQSMQVCSSLAIAYRDDCPGRRPLHAAASHGVLLSSQPLLEECRSKRELLYHVYVLHAISERGTVRPAPLDAKPTAPCMRPIPCTSPSDEAVSAYADLPTAMMVTGRSI